MQPRRAIVSLGTMLLCCLCKVLGQSVSVPFDFSRSEIGIEITVRGQLLYMFLDTGVDPSVIDLTRARELHLEVKDHDGGEASGFGGGKGAAVFPTSIDDLQLGGRDFPRVAALASDLSTISAKYGRKVDGFLGYSFLSDKIVLVDYPDRTLTILSRLSEVKKYTSGCRTTWSTGLRTVENYPVIPRFRFGGATAPVTLDTGSNSDMALFQSALNLPGMRSSLREKGTITHTGFRGEAKSTSYMFNGKMGFGPFTLPEGQPLFLHAEEGSASTRVANVGNRSLDAMKLKMLLDYRGKKMIFYGSCAK